MNYAPIALFVYNRLEHTTKVISSLLSNSLSRESDLIIFSDGPKNKKEVAKVNELRNYLKTLTGFKSIEVRESIENKGLADSITDGISEVLEKFEKIIVLEDDVFVSPYFLEYMNTALELYSNDTQVMQISGYLYPLKDNNLPQTFFCDRTSSWGWATWQRAWKYFESDNEKLVATLKEKTGAIDKMNLGGKYNFMSAVMANYHGRIKTWAIKWQASVVLADGLCLWPNKSLVKNLGLDGSGENCEEDKTLNSPLYEGEFKIEKISPIEINLEAQKKIVDFYVSIKPSKFAVIKNRLRLWFKNINQK